MDTLIDKILKLETDADAIVEKAHEDAKALQKQTDAIVLAQQQEIESHKTDFLFPGCLPDRQLTGSYNHILQM